MYKDIDSGEYRDYKSFEDPPIASKGWNQTPNHVALFGNRRVTRVFTRYSYNAAVLEDSSLVTWGMGHAGELARSELHATGTRSVNGVMKYDLARTFFYEDVTDEDGKVLPLHRPNYDLVRKAFLTPTPPIFNPNVKRHVVSVACGSMHLLVVTREPPKTSTSVFASGNNTDGQLGLGDNEWRHELTLVRTTL